MARTVLVIHGAGEPRRRRGRVYWEPLIGNTLGPGYRVRAPRMPRPGRPHYRTWAQRIDELIVSARRPILVGHSFGASVLLKYLSETVRRPAFAGLFLIATPLWGADFPEFALAPDFGERLRDVAPLYLTTAGTTPRSPLRLLSATARSCLTPGCGPWRGAATNSISRSSRNSRPTFAVSQVVRVAQVSRPR